MPPDVLARLFQQRSQTCIIRFDEQAVVTATLDALERDFGIRFKTPLWSADDLEFLQKMKLLTQDEEGGLHPSVSGILAASRNPEKYLSNAYVQAVCYRGTERNAAYQEDAEDILGPIDMQIRENCRFVERNCVSLRQNA
jgi:ATP-dependent DNA helicase RecG